MTISDCVMVAAVILGPILAVQAQKLIESWRAGRDRKMAIFKTLMATRGTPVSPAHVQALNMIDLEFSATSSKEKAVLAAWKIYLDHLSSGPRNFQEPDYQAKMEVWTSRSQDCLVDLLYTMGKVLKYDFDKVQLRKGAYTPQGHTDVEFEQSMLRKGTLELVYGNRPLPVKITVPNKS